jgi:hypothetical protein
MDRQGYWPAIPDPAPYAGLRQLGVQAPAPIIRNKVPHKTPAAKLAFFVARFQDGLILSHHTPKHPSPAVSQNANVSITPVLFVNSCTILSQRRAIVSDERYFSRYTI